MFNFNSFQCMNFQLKILFNRGDFRFLLEMILKFPLLALNKIDSEERNGSKKERNDRMNFCL